MRAPQSRHAGRVAAKPLITTIAVTKCSAISAIALVPSAR